MSNVQKTVFKPNPIQRNFIESRAKADLFSSRLGEGKSTAIAWSCLYHTRFNPGARWVIIRDTFENLTKSTMKTFFQWFPPGIYGTYHGGNKTFTWANGVAKGEVIFMGMDAAQDASKLMSVEIGGFGMDEPAPAMGNAGIDEFIFDMAISRLRQPDMQWYAAKLAENNPDEAHWTYKKFVVPGTPDFQIWQPQIPENVQNLPKEYYSQLRDLWKHRPDLVRRFVDGEFGFQAIGKAVTPQWNDKLHLKVGLVPISGAELTLCWDFGHTPVCLVTQVTPMGHWDILDACCGIDMGVEELIEQQVQPLLRDYKRRFNVTWRHTGDPMGKMRAQDTIQNFPVKTIRSMLGGVWKPGPVPVQARLDPLHAVLTKTVGGSGKVRVDRDRAAPVWHALRGGWHYHIAANGLISGVPVKDHPASDVGDAMGYGAAYLWPTASMAATHKFKDGPGMAGYFAGDLEVRQLVAEAPGATHQERVQNLIAKEAAERRNHEVQAVRS